MVYLISFQYLRLSVSLSHQNSSEVKFKSRHKQKKNSKPCVFHAYACYAPKKFFILWPCVHIYFLLQLRLASYLTQCKTYFCIKLAIINTVPKKILYSQACNLKFFGKKKKRERKEDCKFFFWLSLHHYKILIFPPG